MGAFVTLRSKKWCWARCAGGRCGTETRWPHQQRPQPAAMGTHTAVTSTVVVQKGKGPRSKVSVAEPTKAAVPADSGPAGHVIRPTPKAIVGPAKHVWERTFPHARAGTPGRYGKGMEKL